MDPSLRAVTWSEADMVQLPTEQMHLVTYLSSGFGEKLIELSHEGWKIIPETYRVEMTADGRMVCFSVFLQREIIPQYRGEKPDANT
jgi:hypothetical protein